MSSSKIIISLLLSVIMLMSVITIVPFTAGAVEANTTQTGIQYEVYQDFSCSIDDEGMAKITGYKGEGGDVSIPSTLGGYPVTSIGMYAFRKCETITSITIPDSVTVIDYGAFSNCTGMTNITIPDSVTMIDEYAFFCCKGLKSINIPKSVTSIGNSAFCGCENLTNLTIPDSVTSLGYCAFGDCKELQSVTIPDSVTCIRNYTFTNCSSLTSVTIPDSVTSIGENAFEGCTELKDVTIPDSVTSIGSKAFNNTAWYDNLPDGLIYIAKVAFKMKGACPDEVVIKAGTLGIAGSAFYECANLTSIMIPDTVTDIGDSAFNHCTSLTSISLGDSVTDIGDSAFSHCTSLTNIDFGSSVTNIGYSAFSKCTGLTNVTLPDSVTSIDGDAFSDCTGLTSINIPDSVTDIGRFAFENCTALTSIDFGNSVTIIKDGTCSGCTSLTSVTIGNSVQTIEWKAFYECAKLTNVIIGMSVTDIGQDAFDQCTSLTNVTIPESVSTIGGSAFGYYYDKSVQYSRKVNGFRIYGYEGTEAENYAKDNLLTFIKLTDHQDEASGVIASVTDGVELRVTDVLDQLPADTIKAYDISLLKNGEPVQPEHVVTVKIPCDDPDAKVYRKEADGTLTDMNAVNQDGYLSFVTTQLSVYFVSKVAEVKPPICGDADGDGKVTVKDATFIQRYLVHLDSGIDLAVITRNCDVDGNGKVTIIDATLIQRFLSGIIDSFPSGKELPTQEPSIVPTETEDATQAATEQAIGQRDRNAHYEVETRVIWCENKGNRIYGKAFIPITDEETKFPLVIHAHGMGSNHEPGANYGKRYAEKGFATYSFDFPGGSRPSKENKSDGDPMKNSAVTEASDLQAVLNTAMTWDFVDPNFIFLEGGSMGGFVATMVGLDNTDTVRGMILLFPALYFPQMATARYNSPDDVPDTLSYGDYQVSGSFVRDLFGLDVVSRLNTYPHNVTIIQGSEDKKVSPSSIKEAAALFPHAEFHLIEGAGHGFSGDDFNTSVEYGLDYLFANT